MNHGYESANVQVFVDSQSGQTKVRGVAVRITPSSSVPIHAGTEMQSIIGYWLTVVGALCFGAVIGWVTYRTLRFSAHGGLSDLSVVIGAVGGAAVTGLFPRESGAFGAYCIGLAFGFFVYLRTAKDPNAPAWLGGSSRPSARADPSSRPPDDE